jgi:hypothetical protein
MFLEALKLQIIKLYIKGFKMMEIVLGIGLGIGLAIAFIVLIAIAFDMYKSEKRRFGENK